MNKLTTIALMVAFNTIVFAQTNNKATATVSQIRGFYVFTDCQPTEKYKYLGTIEGANVGLKTPQYDVVRDGLLKKLREKYPEADGAILNFNSAAKDKADAIKFE
jgi:hypothetical protein